MATEILLTQFHCLSNCIFTGISISTFFRSNKGIKAAIVRKAEVHITPTTITYYTKYSPTTVLLSLYFRVLESQPYVIPHDLQSMNTTGKYTTVIEDKVNMLAQMFSHSNTILQKGA